MPNIPNLALRGLELFFGILILGLSGHLVASQRYGGAPSATNYNVFLGIWVFVISIIGLVGSFIDALAGLPSLILDALTVLFTFAGGVAFANLLGTEGCSCGEPDQNCDRLNKNHIINGGINEEKMVDTGLNRVNRCREAQADTAFIWFAFAAFVGTMVLSLLAWRRGRVGKV